MRKYKTQLIIVLTLAFFILVLNALNIYIEMNTSDCCGAEPSYLSDEICSECLEHACFNELEE